MRRLKTWSSKGTYYVKAVQCILLCLLVQKMFIIYFLSVFLGHMLQRVQFSLFFKMFSEPFRHKCAAELKFLCHYIIINPLIKLKRTALEAGGGRGVKCLIWI